MLTKRMSRDFTLVRFFEIRYEKMRDFNVHWKAEYGQLNLAHTRNQKQKHTKNKLKQTNAVPTKSGPSSRSAKADLWNRCEF